MIRPFWAVVRINGLTCIEYRHSIPAPVDRTSGNAQVYRHVKNKPSTPMNHVTCKSKLRSVVRSSIHTCPGNWAVIGRVVVYLCPGCPCITCKHCMPLTFAYKADAQIWFHLYAQIIYSYNYTKHALLMCGTIGFSNLLIAE